jgi:hypothetical protein
VALLFHSILYYINLFWFIFITRSSAHEAAPRGWWPCYFVSFKLFYILFISFYFIFITRMPGARRAPSRGDDGLAILFDFILY